MNDEHQGRPMLRLFLGSFCFMIGLVLFRICSLARRADTRLEGSALFSCIGAIFCLAGLLILVWPAFRPKRRT